MSVCGIVEVHYVGKRTKADHKVQKRLRFAFTLFLMATMELMIGIFRFWNNDQLKEREIRKLLERQT